MDQTRWMYSRSDSHYELLKVVMPADNQNCDWTLYRNTIIFFTFPNKYARSGSPCSVNLLMLMVQAFVHAMKTKLPLLKYFPMEFLFWWLRFVYLFLSSWFRFSFSLSDVRSQTYFITWFSECSCWKWQVCTSVTWFWFSFALQYTMNIILSVVQTLDPVPGNICRVIFIGKVYWRQEMTDLVFSIVMDWGLSMKRKKMSKLPEFDHEELAERVMELLYRQVWCMCSNGALIGCDRPSSGCQRLIHQC